MLMKVMCMLLVLVSTGLAWGGEAVGPTLQQSSVAVKK